MGCCLCGSNPVAVIRFEIVSVGWHCLSVLSLHPMEYIVETLLKELASHKFHSNVRSK